MSMVRSRTCNFWGEKTPTCDGQLMVQPMSSVGVGVGGVDGATTWNMATNNRMAARPTAPKPNINMGRLDESLQEAFKRSRTFDERESGGGGFESAA